MTDKSHKLAAIVFTDIVGYTRQMEQNEQQTMKLLQKQRDIVFPLVEEYGGEVIKEIGDGLLMMFSSAVQAVRFAIDVQTRLKDDELTIRAGIHIGDVIFKDGDVFGSAVNTAARIEPLAPPNGICISDDVRSQVKNKEGIRTVSLGSKKLKGVDEALEIFRINLEEETEGESVKQVGILQDLWQRRVPQTMVSYLILSWLVSWIIKYLVNSYLWSPHLVSLTWVVLLSLIPSVFLITYFHGRRKEEKWKRLEIIGLPVNLVVTILITVFIFNGKDLGAATKTVTFENEDGLKVEKVIVKNEFRKKIALFFFENKTGNKEYDWAQYSFANLLEYDLSQDIFIDIRTPYKFINKLVNAGFEDGLGVPVTLMQKISGYYHLDYFVTGSFDKTNEDYNVTIKIHKTASGQLLKENSFNGPDPFSLVDEIAVQIKYDLKIPEDHITSTRDFPIADIFTSSPEALKFFTKGINARMFENDFSNAIGLLEKASQTDSSFAVAHFNLANLYFQNNNVEGALTALHATKKNLHKLPDRIQFQTKSFLYLIQHRFSLILLFIIIYS